MSPAPASVDTLTALARIVLANHPQPDFGHVHVLSVSTGLSEAEVEAAIIAAQEIAANHQSGPSSLERHQADPATYIIRPETSACVEVHDPNRPGHGYAVSIHADTDGPGIEVWPLAPHQAPTDDNDEPLDRIDWAFDVLDELI